MVGFGRCTGVNIKGNAKILERFFDYSMVLVHNILRRYPLLPCLYGYWYAMLIGATNRNHIYTFHPKVTGVDIGGNVNTGKVTDVNWAVCVRQCRCDQVTFIAVHSRKIKVAQKNKPKYGLFAILN